jgi:hypothetical protein
MSCNKSHQNFLKKNSNIKGYKINEFDNNDFS